jgi:hypothetical protein
VTGLLSTCGQEFQDWSACYRLFSRHRFPAAEVFSVIRRAALRHLPPQAPLRVALDDSLLRKTGARIPGVAWRRDPLGPHFQTNFVRAQRFLQFSASVPLPNGAHRLVPISFSHAPTPAKPSSKASDEERKAYRKASRQSRLTVRAAEQISALRQALDTEPDGAARLLQIFADGGYTNEAILKKLPANTSFAGRVRKDAKLYFLPDSLPCPRRGRPRRYGALAPTPEQLRVDEAMPWQPIPISIHGTTHQMRIKHRANLLWRTAGLNHTLQLVVIAPLGYQLRKGSKLLYRKPAFLVCTDPHMDVHAIVQGYIQRWDIEVNFREEKTLFGVGQAQVRHSDSVEAVPAMQVASYSMLLLAGLRAFPATTPSPDLLPRPKWASRNNPPRFSTQRAIQQLRAETWGRALGIRNFSDFASQLSPVSSPEKFPLSLSSAVLYASN